MKTRPELARLLREIVSDEQVAVRKSTQMSQAEISLLVKDRKRREPKPRDRSRLS
jgi:hypothetical protein